MNYHLNNLPERTKKPREFGFTMVIDKGLSIREVDDFISVCSDYVDIVKFGWGTLKKIAMLGYNFSPVSNSVREGVKAIPEVVIDK